MKAADGSAALGRPNPADELLGPLEKEKEFPAPKGLGVDRCLFPLGAPDANNPNEDEVALDDTGTASGKSVASAK